MLNTAVALIIFNRPDTTEKVLAEIARVEPKKLFVIADGARAGNTADLIKCNAARAVIERVDWGCQIYRNYSDQNLGCGERPATGIGWVFEHVETAIFIEDDCVPHPSFFWYCEELLEKYKNDYRIMHISGTKREKNLKNENASYTFSKFPIACGGFATWKRAWQKYDFEMKLWPDLRNSKWLRYYLANEKCAEAYKKIFDFTYLNLSKKDFWDYQWIFAVMVNNALSISPNANLHTNIGFREDGTHTTTTTHKYANIPIQEMKFPLAHPKCIIPDFSRDMFIIEDVIRSEKEGREHLGGIFKNFFGRVIPEKYKKEIKKLYQNNK